MKNKDVIIACDFENAKETLDFLDLFSGKKPMVKIGMELYYSEGNQIIKEIKKRGHDIFLDLKLHDIPNTVEKAMKILSKADVDMINVHAAGGTNMMHAAVRGIQRENGKRPLLIAVTQLTSTSQEIMEKDLMINHPMQEVVAHYGKKAKEAGLDGVVCSPLESEIIHEKCGKNFLTVTPGIRIDLNSKGDQSRVTTPAKARQNGSDYIVVGRSITESDNPVEAYEYCLKEFLY